ncbi:MAG: glycosyltransferase family 4 protein [Candidatus Ozemobacteraceae bacterium]
MAQSCDRITAGLRKRGVRIDIGHFTVGTQIIRVSKTGTETLFSVGTGNDPSHAIHLLWNHLKLARERGNEAPTHIVAFGGTIPFIAGPIFARWLGVPLITMMRGNDFDTAIFSPTRRPMLEQALTFADRVCVVSRDHETKIHAWLPHVLIERVANGIDAHEWQLLASERAAAASWRAGEVVGNRRVIGLFGHLKAKKGVLFFLETLANSGFSDKFHVLMVGEAAPELAEHLNGSFRSLSLTRLPFMDRYNILPWFAACDLVGIPSFYDGMPNVLLEAGSLGIPCLAARAGGIPDVIEQEGDPLLFHPGDPHGLREALWNASQISTERLSVIGKVLQERIATSFTADREADSYFRIFQAFKTKP